MTVVVRRLGLQDYVTVWHAMRDFTENRNADSSDELWFVSHPPVYTQGQAGKAEHILNPGAIPIVQIDRGGQVTYHGPGQLLVYLMVDVRRRQLGVRELVDIIEDSIIAALDRLGIGGKKKSRAPGVYLNDAKIAALGLRIRRGCSYHGMSLNVDMDLEPFSRINPCGFEGLQVTQVADHVKTSALSRNTAGSSRAKKLMLEASELMVDELVHRLGYSEIDLRDSL